jgi:hypothetical protein
MKLRKYIVRGVLGGALVLLGLIGASLASADFELTEHGVHKRLLLPLGPLGTAGINMRAGTGDRPVLPGFLDGPVVKVDVEGGWSATWFCEDRVGRRGGTEPALVIDCAGKSHTFDLTRHAHNEPDVVAMPPKLLVLSDIEGNIAFLDAALRNLGVVDAAGKWAYGANRLVIAGDSVDRGRDVFAVLWRLHGLGLQARAAGGALHMLLGNHEQYLLRGNVSRANVEHLYALEQMGGHARAFAADTLLGKWLREQPVVMKAGSVLITHGGISAAVAAQGLSVPQLNDAMRRYWRGEKASTAELDSVVGPGGISQYRGYFQAIEGSYDKASEADVASALRPFGASAVVVGHTQVDKVTTLYGGRVHAVDVNTNEAAPEALLFERGVATVVNVGTGRLLPPPERRLTRALNLSSGDDWRTLGRAASRSYELSRLPHPY